MVRASTARADRVQATRARVVGSAGPLFVELGYLETTMAGLAAAAGVSVQTLYLSFGGKAAVLEAAWAAAGEDQPTGWLERLRTAPDGPSAVAAHVATTCAGLERRHPLAGVLRAAAADPQCAELLARAAGVTLATHAAAVDELADRPGFTTRVSLQRATEIVACVLSPEVFAMLVGMHGWSAPDWIQWSTRHLVAELFPG